jgi:hypothetical protein
MELILLVILVGLILPVGVIVFIVVMRLVDVVVPACVITASEIVFLMMFGSIRGGLRAPGVTWGVHFAL